jgi:hypothetical protein
VDALSALAAEALGFAGSLPHLDFLFGASVRDQLVRKASASCEVGKHSAGPFRRLLPSLYFGSGGSGHVVIVLPTPKAIEHCLSVFPRC